jgi:hypothetical protein
MAIKAVRKFASWPNFKGFYCKFSGKAEAEFFATILSKSCLFGFGAPYLFGFGAP